MRMRQGSSGTTYGRSRLARVAAALLAVLMLAGVLRAGASYVYCPAMRMVADAACCSGDRSAEHEDADTIQVRTRDCCEKHVVGRLPAVRGAVTAAHALAAPLLAVLPAPTTGPERSDLNVGFRFDHEGRAGPIASARHRAELMVSLN